jgi:hypothetical protein
MSPDEIDILEALDRAVQAPSVRAKIDRIVARVVAALEADPRAPMAWEPIPLALYDAAIPAAIRSSWVFVLRAGIVSGAERHPNSHQRMTSYRGRGDFQTRPGEQWLSHRLTSDPAAPLEQRWISIPTNVWHQGVVPDEHWAVVSFQTAGIDELIEERPLDAGESGVRRRKYVE